MLTVGDAFPSFDLLDDAGNRVTQADLTGTTVIYFYPKDDTPGCTKQACAFRDAGAAYRERGARIFGVSADDAASHTAFKAKFRLNFPLICDLEHTLCDAVGVWGPQTFRGHTYEGIARTTFILRDGVISEIFEKVDVMGHAERVLGSL